MALLFFIPQQWWTVAQQFTNILRQGTRSLKTIKLTTKIIRTYFFKYLTSPIYQQKLTVKLPEIIHRFCQTYDIPAFLNAPKFPWGITVLEFLTFPCSPTSFQSNRHLVHDCCKSHLCSLASHNAELKIDTADLTCLEEAGPSLYGCPTDSMRSSDWLQINRVANETC